MNLAFQAKRLGKLEEGCPAESTWLDPGERREPRRTRDLGLSAKMLHIAWITLTKPTFPAPDHDHDRCTADGIDHAARVFVQRSQKFTPVRPPVLQALLFLPRPRRAF